MRRSRWCGRAAAADEPTSAAHTQRAAYNYFATAVAVLATGVVGFMAVRWAPFYRHHRLAAAHAAAATPPVSPTPSFTRVQVCPL